MPKRYYYISDGNEKAYPLIAVQENFRIFMAKENTCKLHYEETFVLSATPQTGGTAEVYR